MCDLDRKPIQLRWETEGSSPNSIVTVKPVGDGRCNHIVQNKRQ